MADPTISLSTVLIERSQANLRQAIRGLELLNAGQHLVGDNWREQLLYEIGYERYSLRVRGIDPKIPDTILAEVILEGYDFG